MYLDPITGRTWPLDPPRWRGDDGAPLLVAPGPGLNRAQLASAARGVWRYAASFPGPVRAPITLGEGATPLVETRIDGVPVLLKLEGANPTGSFKDRGASVMLSLLREQGVGAVLEDSSGNGGAAIATYAAAGGMQATIFVPEQTSPAKILQARASGASIVRVSGSRQDCAAAAEAAAEHPGLFYASHNWHPFFLEGTKTLAFELWEQLGFELPDAVVTPCGAGSIVLGCRLGFDDLQRAGATPRVPTLFAVQPEACAPIAAAFDGRAPAAPRPTLAEGTAIASPIRRDLVVAALRDTGGAAVTATEAEIADATLELARMGVFVEPTCAQVLVGFRALLRAGRIRPGDRTVLVMTATGLKAAPRILELLDAPR